MLIDCDTCRAPSVACRDCVMSVLLELESRPVDLDAAEVGALGALAGAGLVPPLRLVVGAVVGLDAGEVAPAPDEWPIGEEERSQDPSDNIRTKHSNQVKPSRRPDARRRAGPGFRGIA